VNEVNKVSALYYNVSFFCHILLYLFYFFLKVVFVVKDFVIEALRSIAELVTYGDQNNPSFFE